MRYLSRPLLWNRPLLTQTFLHLLMSACTGESDDLPRDRSHYYACFFGGSRIIHGSIPDEKLASAQQAKLEAKLDGYETILAKHRYLGGDVRSELFLPRITFITPFS